MSKMDKQDNLQCFVTSFIIDFQHAQAPLSWLWGSDIVVVDPPRKGMDPSLLNTLRAIPSLEKKAKPPGRLEFQCFFFVKSTKWMVIALITGNV